MENGLIYIRVVSGFAKRGQEEGGREIERASGPTEGKQREGKGREGKKA